MMSVAWLGLGISLSLAVAGAEPDSKSAVTRVEDADADFAVQGEYTGPVWWQGRYQHVGLQIVALGDGKFDALAYPGGLPGNGYNGGTKTKLSGARTDTGVALSSEGVQIAWQPGLAVTVADGCGRAIGYLQRLNRYSSTTGALPPANAKVLFNGTDTGLFKNAKISDAGLLQIGAETVDPVRDFTLHAEFKTPYMPYARSQARGNSGFYLQKRYEVQVLDSFGLEPAVNEAASLYKFKAPDMNMSFPPLSWQTYDIHFTAARFDAEGKRTAKARITVRHNGVVVQNNLELDNKTGGGSQEGPNPLPILLQNHGNPIEFRNIWLVDHAASPATCPCPQQYVARQPVRWFKRR
ncbi:MAG TPA: DUF1080 domain-containing protein [Planctomycetaceae bacterium]|nr:DUF1080 domain-containing protein [Planctomycetaceae bacterium]